jgi:hypothetical protein
MTISGSMASLLSCSGCHHLDVHRLLPHRPAPPHPLGLDGGEELALQGSGSASISSRNRVPPAAVSNNPGLARLASVKAPAVTPNSSASSNVSGMAAQLTSRKGPWARGPLSWSTRATSPLPVPVSPWSSTVGTAGFPTVSKAARCRSWARKAARAGHVPTRRAVGWRGGCGEGWSIGSSCGCWPQTTRGWPQDWPLVWPLGPQ